jgi:protein O-GlcNAc transferase
MSNSNHDFTRALADHRGGRLDAAARRYRAVLQQAPSHAAALCNLAAVLGAQGAHDQAEACYRQLIAATPGDAEAHANFANLLTRCGRHDEAVTEYRTAIDLKPDLATARINLGQLCLSLDRPAEAAEQFAAAAAIAPERPECQFHLGVAQERSKQREAARAAYRAALELDPGFVSARRNLAVLEADDGPDALAQAIATLDAYRNSAPPDAALLFQLGHMKQCAGDKAGALACYHQAAAMPNAPVELHNNLAILLLDRNEVAQAAAALESVVAAAPNFAEAWNNLGNARLRSGDVAGAEAAYRRTLAINPDFALAHGNLGNALRSRGQLDAADAAFRAALELAPDVDIALNGLALVAQSRNRHEEAVGWFERALKNRPDFVEARNNLAISLLELGRFAEAAAAYQAVIEAAPHIPEAYFNLGSLLQVLGRYDESATVFSAALKVNPNYGAVYPLLAHSLMQQCSWGNLDAVVAQIRVNTAAEIANGQTCSLSPFALLSLPGDFSAELRVQVGREAAAKYARNVRGLTETVKPRHRMPADHRITIGYMSPDFRFHSVAVAFKGLLAAHDRSRFRLIGYPITTFGRDAMTAELARGFDDFVDITQMPYAEAAERIAADGVNILVDLAGHTRGVRYEVFALRAAPIQAHYLGYSNPIGADYLDYLITDPVYIPPGSPQAGGENLLYLPDSFMATSHPPVAVRQWTRAEAGLPDAGFVFANFNSHYKFEPTLFAIWMRLLKRVPGSVLWLLQGTPTSTANLRREAQMRGVDPARLVFASKLPHPEHLARQRLADLALDNLYLGGGVTTTDALWIGLPVLTLAGEAPPSRNGATLLHAMRLPELVTNSIDEYQRLAYRLATQPAELAAIKAKLAEHRDTAPLFNATRLTRHLEHGYELMWANHMAGNAPRTITVPPLDGAA